MSAVMKGDRNTLDIARSIKVARKSAQDLIKKNTATPKTHIESSELIHGMLKNMLGYYAAAPKPQTLSEDASTVNKAVNLILEATANGTLTDNEANTILTHIVDGFTRRRFDKVFEKITTVGEQKWFIAAAASRRHIHSE